MDIFKDEIKLFVTRKIKAKSTNCVTCYAWKGKNQARGLTIENSILSQKLPATIWGAVVSLLSIYKTLSFFIQSYRW